MTIDNTLIGKFSKNDYFFFNLIFYQFDIPNKPDISVQNNL